MFKFIFWFSVMAIVYTYIGYPVLMAVLAAFRKRKFLPVFSEYPKVSIVMSVFNEEKVIEKKIKNCLNINYPGNKLEILIGSDGCTDKTNEIVKKFRSRRIKFLSNRKRQGKPYVINELVKAAKGEILLFTDARQLVYKDALMKLVPHFEDPNVGCVSGGLTYGKEDSVTGEGIGSYWKYEKFIRKAESDVYSMVGATGAIYACRKELFEPLPEDIILDDMWTPFVVVGKRYRALFEPKALAYDVFAETPRDEHRRKVRTLSGNYQLFCKMPYMLNPFKSRIAFQIISHKLCRLLIPFFMITLFLSNLPLLGEGYYNAFFVAQALFYAFVLIELLFRRHLKGILGIPYLFCVLNFSALVGLWRFLVRGIDVKWEKAVG